jgi:cyclase
LSSVDRDGTKKGMDLALIAHVRSCTNLPIIGSGGVGSVINIVEAFKSGNLEGVAVGTTLHSNFLNIRDIKDNLHSSGIDVRIDQ